MPVDFLRFGSYSFSLVCSTYSLLVGLELKQVVRVPVHYTLSGLCLCKGEAKMGPGRPSPPY